MFSQGQEECVELLWKAKYIWQQLPEELQDTIFSMETSDAIADASENNNVTDKRVSKIAKYTGRVLMGILLTSEFEQTLQKKV